MLYTGDDLVKVAKRENNSKRGYLIVDPLQAKHIPVLPHRALQLFDALTEKIKGKYNDDNLLFIGFAETATAIGARVACNMKCPYIQTTREIIDDVDYLFFSEEHSHATEQKLIKNDMDTALSTADRIIFVEDEVSTGKTILNIISIIDKIYPGIQYSVLSLLNGMEADHINKYQEENIDLIYLLKTCHNGYSDIASGFIGDGIYHLPDSSETNINITDISGLINTRRLTDTDKYISSVRMLSEHILSPNNNFKDSEILVIGTEETMYPAIFTAYTLEQKGNTVYTHSTTRSPISVSSEKEYPLHERYELRSLYDSNRVTYIYELKKYDKVIVITDSACHDKTGINTLVNALKSKGNNDISIYRWIV